MRVINVDQGSDEWHELRFRSITGTRFQNAIGAKYSKAKGWTLGNKDVQKTLLNELVSELQSEIEIDDFCSEAMERGNQLEPVSVKLASEKLGKNFVTCGMLQSDIYKCFRYSPDSVCYENGIIIGGYETKAESGKKHISYIINNTIPKDHLWQCICPMVMDDNVQWWAFGSYDDRNHVNPLFTTIVKREDYKELIEESKAILHEFIIRVRKTVTELGGYYNG